jgi:hypothetical protein
MGLPPWAWFTTGWLALEALMLAALAYLHRRTGLYYLPRGRPRLSRQATATLERFVAEDGLGALMQHSATLGWTVRPNTQSPNGRVHINACGLRGTRETSRTPPPGVVRVLTFGDCLTFGGGVSDDDTFQRIMEKNDPRLDVLNFGVDGFGPVQMLLRYRESAEWCGEHGVAILCMSSSNVFKPLNAFRPFMAYDHGLPFGLPRASLREDRLEIIPNPLPSLNDYRVLLANPDRELRRIGALDDYYLAKFAVSAVDMLPSARMARMLCDELRKLARVITLNGVYRESSRAVATTIAVLEHFAAEARWRGARPIVAVLPTPRDVGWFVSCGINSSAPVIAQIRRRGIECVDLLDDLGPEARDGGHLRVFTDRHYSAVGNAIVARRLMAVIHSEEPGAEINHPGGRTPVGMPRAAPDP